MPNAPGRHRARAVAEPDAARRGGRVRAWRERAVPSTSLSGPGRASPPSRSGGSGWRRWPRLAFVAAASGRRPSSPRLLRRRLLGRRLLGRSRASRRRRPSAFAAALHHRRRAPRPASGVGSAVGGPLVDPLVEHPPGGAAGGPAGEHAEVPAGHDLEAHLGDAGQQRHRSALHRTRPARSRRSAPPKTSTGAVMSASEIVAVVERRPCRRRARCP